MFDFISLGQACLLAVAATLFAFALAAWFTTTEPDITVADVQWRSYQACGFALAAFFFAVLLRLSL